MLTVRHAGRRCRLTHNPDLLFRYAHKPVDDNADHGLTHIVAIGFFNVPCQLGGRPATRLQVLHQTGCELAVRTHDACGGEFRVAPDEYFHGIAGTNHVVVVQRGRALAGRRRRMRAAGGQQCNHQRYQHLRNRRTPPWKFGEYAHLLLLLSEPLAAHIVVTLIPGATLTARNRTASVTSGNHTRWAISHRFPHYSRKKPRLNPVAAQATRATDDTRISPMTQPPPCS